MFSRSRKSLLAALILPLLVLKGMLPAGYMPSVEEGQLRIVMCSEGLAQQGSGDDPLPASAAPGCAFAVASLAALPPTLPAVLAPASCHVLLRGAPGTCIAPVPSLKRSQSPRGPPADHSDA